MKNLSKMALIYAMMAMSGVNGIGYDEPKLTQRKHQEKNWMKKCFRPGCEHTRKGNKLYCSAECCKIDKNRIRI